MDPVVFFELQLVMFFEDLRSERRLVRVVCDRLSSRWYLGHDLDEPLPDPSEERLAAVAAGVVGPEGNEGRELARKNALGHR